MCWAATAMARWWLSRCTPAPGRGRGGARRGPCWRLRAGRGIRLLAGLAAGMPGFASLARGGEVRVRRWRIRAIKCSTRSTTIAGASANSARPTCASGRLLAAWPRTRSLLSCAAPGPAFGAPGRRPDAAVGAISAAGALHAATVACDGYVPAGIPAAWWSCAGARGGLSTRPGLVDGERARRAPRGTGTISARSGPHRGNRPPRSGDCLEGESSRREGALWARTAAPPALGASEVHVWCVDLDAAGADGGGGGGAVRRRAHTRRAVSLRARPRALPPPPSRLRHLPAGYAGREPTRAGLRTGRARQARAARDRAGSAFPLGRLPVLAVDTGRRVGVDVERIEAERATWRWRAASSLPPRRPRWWRRRPPSAC